MTLLWVFVQPTENSFRSSRPSYLQKACELDHSPAQPGHVRLHQAHLVNVDSQEPLEHAAVLGDHRARDQVAVVCGRGGQSRVRRGPLPSLTDTSQLTCVLPGDAAWPRTLGWKSHTPGSESLLQVMLGNLLYLSGLQIPQLKNGDHAPPTQSTVCEDQLR